MMRRGGTPVSRRRGRGPLAPCRVRRARHRHGRAAPSRLCRRDAVRAVAPSRSTMPRIIVCRCSGRHRLRGGDILGGRAGAAAAAGRSQLTPAALALDNLGQAIRDGLPPRRIGGRVASNACNFALGRAGIAVLQRRFGAIVSASADRRAPWRIRPRPQRVTFPLASSTSTSPNSACKRGLSGANAIA